jgi:hypothetical protein
MNKSRLIISIAMGAVIAGLLVVSVMNFVYRADFDTGAMMADDIKKLARIFDEINKTAGIVSFDHQQNVINFLTIGSFTGSEVGSMNLAYPAKWKGHYVKDNPEIQGKEYMVVRTKKGYFITPGNEVKLPNGAIIGQTLILDENADIQAMMADRNKLYFHGRVLAAPITIRGSNNGQFADAWRMEN